jgi:glucose/arabinose dehydrogenase
MSLATRRRLFCWRSVRQQLPGYRLALFVVASILNGPAVCQAQNVGVQHIADLPVLGDLSNRGIARLGFAPGRPNDLFAAQLDGTLLRIDLTNNSVSTFATIPDVDTHSSGMYGFLGFAFHPDYATNGKLYAYVADDEEDPTINHRSYIREFTISNPLSNTPTLGPATNLLRFDQPGVDHKGGFLGFQPGDANTLWITSGDGQNNDGNPDPTRSGQNPNDLRGSVLRIDITGDDFPADPNRNYKIPENNPFAGGVGGAPEVWNYGLRSPFAASFDRANGDFIWGDVGQVTREEIDFERAGTPGGRNYGWRTMEGSVYGPYAHDPGELPANDPSFTPPIYDYEHSGGYGSGNSPQFEGRSVTGGNVYRGPISELAGTYIFGDWSSRQVWGLKIDRDANGGRGGVEPGSLVDFTEAFERPVGGEGNFGSGVTAFGEDAEGNLYFSELGGRLFKICALGELNCGPQPEPPKSPREPALTLRDDFTASHSYQNGSVPAGNMWTGTHNADFGDTFNANTANAGNLTIGLEPVGWQGDGADSAPLLFRDVPAENLMEVRVRIEQQSAGNWSSAGILVRVAGPLDNESSNDNFLSTHAFRANDDIQVSNVIAGVEAEGNSPGAGPNGTTFLRLVSLGAGEFEVFSSTDGTDWISRSVVTNAALASGPLEVGVWAGCYAGGNNSCTSGTARFDWAEIVLGVPAGDFNEDGTIDAADYVVWRDTAGQPVAAWDGADGNGDGMVDTADYDVWRTNFGRTIPNFSAAGSALLVVPEPANIVAALYAASASALFVRRRHLNPRTKPL